MISLAQLTRAREQISLCGSEDEIKQGWTLLKEVHMTTRQFGVREICATNFTPLPDVCSTYCLIRGASDCQNWHLQQHTRSLAVGLLHLDVCAERGKQQFAHFGVVERRVLVPGYFHQALKELSVGQSGDWLWSVVFWSRYAADDELGDLYSVPYQETGELIGHERTEAMPEQDNRDLAGQDWTYIGVYSLHSLVQIGVWSFKKQSVAAGQRDRDNLKSHGSFCNPRNESALPSPRKR